MLIGVMTVVGVVGRVLGRTEERLSRPAWWSVFSHAFHMSL